MTTTDLVPVFTGTLAGKDTPLCNARDLHTYLKSEQDFSNWIKFRIECGFTEGEDYSINLSNRSDGRAGRRRIDYHLTLDMAKHIALMERNEQGHQVRRYFIAMEKQAREAPAIRKTGRYEAQPIPAPSLGEIGEWIARQYAQHATRYLYRSGQSAATQLRAGIEARFGMHVRDIPVARLPELLATLDGFADDCFRLWQASLQIEGWLIDEWRQRGDGLPPEIKTLMAQVVVPSGPETARGKVRENLRAMLPESTK